MRECYWAYQFRFVIYIQKWKPCGTIVLLIKKYGENSYWEYVLWSGKK